MRILGISGSIRRDSYNRRLLEALSGIVPAGATLDIWDALKAVPPYDQDDEHHAPHAITDLRAALASSDALLVSTPEYNSSVPGALKNALDWISRPLAESPVRNMPVVVLSASTGAFGGIWAQADLRRILAALGARVVDVEVAVSRVDTRFDEAGALADEDIERELLGALDLLRDEVDTRARVAA